MATFYTCRNDRAFKEVFLKPDNSDLLKALLEFILKIKIHCTGCNSCPAADHSKTCFIIAMHEEFV